MRGSGSQTDISEIPAVEQKSVVGIALIIGTGSTGKEAGALGAALPELGAI